MNRYIDAYALDRAFSKLRFNNDGELEHYGDRSNWYLWGSEVENLIANAPSIDIVRCGECKHKTYCYGDVLWTNKRQTVDIHKTVDFCSYGEREGE